MVAVGWVEGGGGDDNDVIIVDNFKICTIKTQNKYINSINFKICKQENNLKVFRLFRKIAKKRTITVVTSVGHFVLQSAGNDAAPTGRIFTKLSAWVLIKKTAQKIKCSLKYPKNDGHAHKGQCIYQITSRSTVLHTERVTPELQGTPSTYFVFTNSFPRNSCRV